MNPIMEPRPVGFRFRPKIEFLIELLQYKAAGGGDITGCTKYPEDLYYMNMYGPGKEPWKLFSGEHGIYELHDVSKRDLKEKYILTDLTKIGNKNVSRTAGAGTWDDRAKRHPIVYDGQEMGYWRTLTYVYWGDEAGDNYYYYMNELHLSEYALRQVHAKRDHDHYVICRVLQDESKCCRIRRGKKRASQDYHPITIKKKKLSRCEEASTSSCSNVVPEEPYDLAQEFFSENVDFFGDVVEVQESYDVTADLCGIEQNQSQEVGSFASNDQSWDYPQMQETCYNPVHEYSSDPVQAPEVLAVAQNEGEQALDYADMLAKWVQKMPDQDWDQDFSTDEWSIEALTNLL